VSCERAGEGQTEEAHALVCTLGQRVKMKVSGLF
jgi:hypothetical protein